MLMDACMFNLELHQSAYVQTNRDQDPEVMLYNSHSKSIAKPVDFNSEELSLWHLLYNDKSFFFLDCVLMSLWYEKMSAKFNWELKIKHFQRTILRKINYQNIYTIYWWLENLDIWLLVSTYIFGCGFLNMPLYIILSGFFVLISFGFYICHICP